MEAGSEWGLVDWFEFIVVTSCFMAQAHKRLYTLWFAVKESLAPEKLLYIFWQASVWVVLLSAYFMLRVDVLILAGLIGWVFFCLLLATVFLVLAGVSSLIAYLGLWEMGKEQLFLLIERWSDRSADYLRMLRTRYYRK